MSGTNLAIPASAIVSVTPSVISAGGNALDLSGLMLTTNARVPIGTVMSFPSQLGVANYFGASSQEALLATNYFLGFDNSNQKPGAMLFAQYNQIAVSGWMRGGPVSTLTLSQLQALTGTLIISIDGTPRTSGTINLSASTSFSNAAELITTALGVTGPAGASITGSITGTVLTVTNTSSGTIVLGQEVRGAGISANTQVASFGTGTGGNGTYNVTVSQTVSSQAMTTNTPTVTYDAVSGGFFVTSSTTGSSSTVGFATGTLATALQLTQATGATSSIGSSAASPAAFMTGVIQVTQDWATFGTAFDPDNGSGNTQKLAFANWVNGTVDRYAYIPWDTDVTPTTSAQATSSLGWIVKTNNLNGTFPIYSPSQGTVMAAFEMGTVASIDFTETNGRATGAFRSQTGLAPDVTNQTIAANLEANGYNYYGSWATANDQFNFMYPGSVSGPFQWIDSYVDQIWLNNQFQLALMVLLTNAKSIPYNAAGYGLIRAALMDPILQGLNFGAFRPGVTLSQAQIAEVNNAAGKKIDDTLSTQGWYLQILDAIPQVRAARKSPPITFWYMDGQSVQRLNLASVEVQ